VGEWIRRHRPAVVDLTGGAPELSEHFRYLVETARDCGCHVIDRKQPSPSSKTGSHRWLPEYLAAHEVEVIASLPCYSADNVNAQRGDGVFEKSISALRKLNAAGFGHAFAAEPGSQSAAGRNCRGPTGELEAEYREMLAREFGIVLQQNCSRSPTSPSRGSRRTCGGYGQWDEYLELLAGVLNPATVAGLMCRTNAERGWRGEIYDCDFNQMLECRCVIPTRRIASRDVTPQFLDEYEIRTGGHCLACTAGGGSSCTGALA